MAQDTDNKSCKTGTDKLFKKQRNALSKAKANEAASGSAMPQLPKLPKMPVMPGNNPVAQAKKQSLGQSALRSPQTPKTPIAPTTPKAPSTPKMGKSEFFNQKRKELTLSEIELFTKCEHCGTSQFIKSENGPKYSPCACFMVTKTEKFVTLHKKESGYSLEFNPSADQESVKAFLLALKAKLLVTKKFGDL